ncbi:WD40 repeat-containing protein [Cynara cardunculus var. scolymus]|uniref:WD40 repeat-containing protein n=1 Tax=Cynara cardunculus var. scolymus TaxID=59895 RepID=A0A103YNQ5_CYNCS|nr:WD40 repeat-containing protein [Cynara cardunculus var. scolymus]
MSMESGQYLGEISALCFLHLPPPSLPYLFAGSLLNFIFNLQFLAIGCTNNTVYFWDTFTSTISYEVSSPDRCLLYTMRMWGHKIDSLLVASGTIFNEIIVWKVVCGHSPPCLDSPSKANDRSYEAVLVCRLAGHEGSIFRITWSLDGSKLVSVSDDRSARIWEVLSGKRDSNNVAEGTVSPSTGPVLFGHSARVWDCCMSDSLIITVGEDCTCRVWGLDGTQLRMIKEHIGRGVWRCLYDSRSSLLVTAGFDSAIKVHQLHSSLSMGLERRNGVEEYDGKQIFTIGIPNSKQTPLLDRYIKCQEYKSEYVRCMHFASEEALYVATNNGFLYLAEISDTGDVVWTQLFQSSEEIPIVCMSAFAGNTPENSSSVENWIALGDGKGRLTVVGVVDIRMPKVNLSFTWPAEAERQLLGTYWCKSLGHSKEIANFTVSRFTQIFLLLLLYRYIFTSDPRGRLKLWNICNTLHSISEYEGHTNASLVAEFASCFPIRIVCLDASFQEEVLVCGDLRGNLVLFPLLRDLLHGTHVASVAHISPLDYFKGAHGISTVKSVSIHGSKSSNVELHSVWSAIQDFFYHASNIFLSDKSMELVKTSVSSFITGGDGCICYMEYDRCKQRMEFIGMKQVKELSLVESLFHNDNPDNNSGTGNYAIGFASADFIIWNLSTDTKVAVIPCGGWRRPHTYFLGDTPEMNNCFAFVKDEVIYMHKQLVPTSDRIYPQNLHLQFHGREMHSLCFIVDYTQFSSDEKLGHLFESSFIATGCEDGTVRLTSIIVLFNDADVHRYSSGADNWSASKLLGEHVGGSAVRSLCSVLKVHTVVDDTVAMPNKQGITLDDQEDQFLLISVGAKRVLTAWKRKISSGPKSEEALQSTGRPNNCENNQSGGSSSMSFQWLSSDFPTRSSGTNLKGSKEKITANLDNVSIVSSDRASDSLQTKFCCSDDHENDWRYLAVTAFLVKFLGSRTSVCFIVVSCSDATVTLRALVLPHRLWFDIALLVPVASPVLSLQHVVVPELTSLKDKSQIRSLFIVISGSTDGSISFWDLTETVEIFMRKVSVLQKEDCSNFQKRPRTGRGSQGGRRWRSLDISKEKPAVDTKTLENDMQGQTSSNIGCAERSMATSQEIDMIWPFHHVNNVHQSGVNCLHVSYATRDCESCIVISGGDDQALHCFCFDVMGPALQHYSQKKKYQIVISHAAKIASAHSSAIKGVWTDGKWVFSTGLDQRVRCWLVSVDGKLSEHAHLIVSVPEPEALDVRVCGRYENQSLFCGLFHHLLLMHDGVALRNRYQIAVAGRGMQMLEFVAPADTGDERLV